MYTVIDYLKYYKNISLKDVHWNTMDNLVCAILVYLPSKSFNDNISIPKLYQSLSNYSENEKSLMIPKALEVLNIIKDSKRYKDLIVSDFLKIKNEKTQFGACTFKIDGKTIVSFQGTDGSFIGWIENFRLAYEYPTYTHSLAINYLSQVASYSSDIVVVGHSKGGNLAMVSAMEIENQEKVKAIYNFDGPGFRLNEFMTEKYKNMQQKLINIVPTDSIVGILLNNKNYSVVSSSEHAFKEHYPTTWNTYGECFIESKLSNISKQLHESTTKGIEELDQEQVKLTFETLFKSVGKSYSSEFKLTFNDIKNIVNNMKGVDPKVITYINTIIDSMIKAIHN